MRFADVDQLAELTGSPVLIRYVNEVSYRCGLTLSMFSRPHSTHCGIQEHRDIVAAPISTLWADD